MSPKWVFLDLLTFVIIIIRIIINSKIEINVKGIIKDNNCMIIILVSDDESKYSKEEYVESIKV